jgi:predicted phage terminase large subunit-like protein
MRDAAEKDVDFPHFRRLSFPAKMPGGGYLFPERYPDDWYSSQYAVQGPTWAAALLDCNPVIEGGERFNVTKIQFHDTLDDFPKGRYVRGWDLASSSKERDKDDPDWTAGVLAMAAESKGGIEELWVKDCVSGQWEAPERNRRIVSTAKNDGARVPVFVEAVGGYKDSFVQLRKILSGHRTVNKSKLQGDKSAKAADMEPIFDVGNVHLLKADWNDIFVRHFQEFPSGKHDDIVDATAISYHETSKGGSTLVPIA